MDRIAVLIPCYNEELTIRNVVTEFQLLLPDATIYVFDNNSNDATAEVARKAGAKVLSEKRQGKGFVVQSMFRKIDADIYIMVDGDDTYDLSRLHEMIEVIKEDQADMVIGSRLIKYTGQAFRPLHTFGNKLVRLLINRLFRASVSDIMTGFRVMNRSFVKNINITAAGFEVETEMTIKALKYNHIIKEIEIEYRERPAGSFSKLNTLSDGFLVLKTIVMIFKDYKPLVFFLSCSVLFFLLSLLSGSVVIDEFIATRVVRHVPLAILASGLMMLSMLFLVTGIIMDSAARRFDEIYSFIRSRE